MPTTRSIPTAGARAPLAAVLVTALTVSAVGSGGLGCGRGARPPVATASGSTAPATPTPRDLGTVAAAADVCHFAIIGDYGLDGPDEARVALLVARMRPEFVVTVGDNNYQDGSAETIDANIGKHYAQFIAFDAAYRGPYRGQEPPTNRFFPVLGNHDWRAPGAAPYLGYFALPGNERYYTVRRGAVEIFAVDSDPHEPDGIAADSVQARWLRDALASSAAPWKLVFLHHPPFSRGEHGSTPALQWPFAAWGADAVFAGHDHHYERLEVGGLTYVVTGAGGAALRPVHRPAIPGATTDVVFDGQHGAMAVDVTAAQLQLRYFGDDGRLLDTQIMAAADRHGPARE